MRFLPSGTIHILKVLTRLVQLHALTTPSQWTHGSIKQKVGWRSHAGEVAGDENRFVGARTLQFLLPEAEPVNGVPATWVVFIENAHLLDIPTPLCVARRCIDLPTPRHSEPLQWRGTLRQLAPSLPRTPNTQPCVPRLVRVKVDKFKADGGVVGT